MSIRTEIDVVRTLTIVKEDDNMQMNVELSPHDAKEISEDFFKFLIDSMPPNPRVDKELVEVNRNFRMIVALVACGQNTQAARLLRNLKVTRDDDTEDGWPSSRTASEADNIVGNIVYDMERLVRHSVEDAMN